MATLSRIALDAMGGDHAPGEVIQGALLAVEEYPDVRSLSSDARVLREHLGSSLRRASRSRTRAKST
jgi:glycerol-3-phosphate acyltransferase PlsX